MAIRKARLTSFKKTTLTIGVDLRCLPEDGSPGAGVAHAARELWYAFQTLKTDAVFVGFAAGKALARQPGIVRLEDASGASLKKAIKHHPVDGLFVASGAVPPGVSVPVFPWAHDLAIFDHPEWFPQSWLKRQMTTRLFLKGLKQAAHVFAISEDTKRAIIKKAKLPASKITVTYQGVEIPLLSEALSRACRGERQGVVGAKAGRYALMLGTVEPRKNINFITDLWPEVLKKLKTDVSLVVAGQDGWGKVNLPDEPWLMRKKKISDKEIATLIHGASVVLVPSLHEGFGRVALEAMAAHVPVIVSDRGALPEVVGAEGLALPLEEKMWIKTIVKLLNDATFRERMIRGGRKRADRFFWPRVGALIAREIQNHLIKKSAR
ncbi:MAG: glycosyltransferase family 1 protein [bacterium]|nr:glycosyltransferase family 1 protein [bacterium]